MPLPPLEYGRGTGARNPEARNPAFQTLNAKPLNPTPSNPSPKPLNPQTESEAPADAGDMGHDGPFLRFMSGRV